MYIAVFICMVLKIEILLKIGKEYMNSKLGDQLLSWHIQINVNLQILQYMSIMTFMMMFGQLDSAGFLSKNLSKVAPKLGKRT